MSKKTTYAVVDIETTGTQLTKDRIIQFGCVLIEQDEIVSSFATDVNPGMVIPKQIESLTGISNTQVAKAPYFEDVAYTLYQMLSDCVFVAHNIHFDYSFLNKELVRCGVPPLQLKGVDTVELAQIFLPTAPSFRLGDLARQFEIDHENPHQAESDAHATGQLFIDLSETIRKLPLITVEAIIDRMDICSMETKDYVQLLATEMRKSLPQLDPKIEIIRGLALRKKVIPLFSEPQYPVNSYPKTKKGKRNLFQEHLDYRPEQAKMMNEVWEHFDQITHEKNEAKVETKNNDSKNLFIEASTGSGKTFGYLLPLSYIVTPENPVIISTVSILLQNQLVYQDIPQLNQFVPRKLYPVLIKSHRHYLDLERFAATLNKKGQSKQYILYQLGILVWLTQTTTGDLDELHLNNFQHPFWEEVTHRGLEYLSEDSTFYSQDFLVQLEGKKRQSNCLIVNHAYLAEESRREKFALPKSFYLVIDEAHHLPETLQKVSAKQFNSFFFSKQVQLIEQGEDSLWQAIEKIFSEASVLSHDLKLLEYIFQDLNQCVLDFFEGIKTILPQDSASLKYREFVIKSEDFDELSIDYQKNCRKMELLLQEGDTLSKNIQKILVSTFAKFLPSEKIILVQFIDILKKISACSDFFNDFYQNNSDSIIKWLTFSDKEGKFGLLHMQDFDHLQLTNTKWFHRFKKILYTGGTLRIGKDKSFLPRELGLSDYHFSTMRSPYDYAAQGKLLIVDDGISLKQQSVDEYDNFVIHSIQKIIQRSDRPLLILFTSHRLLQKTYQRLHMKWLVEGREILAQGISGSKEKMLKRFANSKNSILLGADSFWEGIDLPGDALEVLIVTKLPFDSPDRPFVKARYYLIENQGLSSFYQEALPKASLRLRQALGRLIRSNEDRGVMILLDSRILKAKYGSRMLKALPKDLPIESGSLDEMILDMQDFFRLPKK